MSLRVGCATNDIKDSFGSPELNGGPGPGVVVEATDGMLRKRKQRQARSWNGNQPGNEKVVCWDRPSRHRRELSGQREVSFEQLAASCHGKRTIGIIGHERHRQKGLGRVRCFGDFCRHGGPVRREAQGLQPEAADGKRHKRWRGPVCIPTGPRLRNFRGSSQGNLRVPESPGAVGAPVPRGGFDSATCVADGADC